MIIEAAQSMGSSTKRKSEKEQALFTSTVSMYNLRQGYHCL